MTVGKLLIGSTLLFVAALLGGGIYYPDTLAMSLAESSPLYTLIRAAIIVLLVSLLVTHPPRSYALRTVIGIGSSFLAILAVQLLFNYQMHVFDALVFLEVAIIFAVEALETRRTIPVSKKHSPARKIPVVSV